MSNKAVGWVWEHSPFTGAPLLVHLAIADVVNDLHHHEFWMTTGELAKKARVSRTATVNALRGLVDGGYLDVVQAGGGRGRGTTFRFRFNETAPNRAGLRSVETAQPSLETGRSDDETDHSGARIGITQEPKIPSDEFSDWRDQAPNRERLTDLQLTQFEKRRDLA